MSKANILIVEDEQIIAMDIQNSLEDSGYQVVGRTDRGEDAITKAGELHPDVVLMDINIKGEMDGIEAAERIRSQFNLPIIFLTAFSDQATLDRARISEPFGYVLKPFNERELISNIEMALYKHGIERKLRESENKFRSVIEHASDGIVLADSLGNIVEWNPAMEQITELKSSDVIGQQAAEVIFHLLPQEKRTIDLRETTIKQWSAAINGGSVNGQHMTENEIETLQGIRRNIQGNKFAIETAQGLMSGVIMRDVTDSKLAKQALNESEYFAHAILNALSSHLAILDKNGVILAVNRGWREFAEENSQMTVNFKTHVGINYLSVCKLASGPNSEEAAAMGQGIYAVINGQAKKFSIEYPCHAPNKKRWFVAHVTRFPGEGPVGVVVAHENITERKLAEEALIVSESQLITHQIELEMQNEQLIQTQTALEDARVRYRDLYELAPVGYLMLREDGLILEANLTAENLIGVARGKLANQMLGHFILPEDQDIFYLCRVQLFETGEPQGCEFRMLENDGSQFWARLEMTITRDADSMPICRAVLSDITKRKLLEQSEYDQRQLSEALRDAATVFNTTLELEMVLDHILDNIGKIASYDAIAILLFESKGIRTVRYRNKFQLEINKNDVSNTQANLINTPILEAMIATRKPYVISNTETDPRWMSMLGMQWIRSFITAPLEIRGRLAGAINLASATPDFFTQEHANRLMAFVSQAAIAMENAQLYEQTKRLSVTDPLTELFNMRYFQDFAKLEFERVRRYSRTLSIAMVDIDHFKIINDTHGHSIGDQVLCEISARIKSSVRAVDVVARYGGDEFIILMPETALNEARQVAERVWRAVAESTIENAGGPISVTLSIGTAEMKKETAGLDELIKCADQALYKAKSSGKNRVEVYSDEEQFYTAGILGVSPVSG
jgi:diguanylate cyclase (GGDEF)-like protein/PAS domain S-box-containing protein